MTIIYVSMKKKLQWNFDTSTCVLNFNKNNINYNIECSYKIADILFLFNEKDYINLDLIDIKYINLLKNINLISINDDKCFINEKFKYHTKKINLLKNDILFKNKKQKLIKIV